MLQNVPSCAIRCQLSLNCLAAEWRSSMVQWNGYGSIPMNTIFSGMNIHLPAILMFTRGTRFWHTAKWKYCQDMPRSSNNSPTIVQYYGRIMLNTSTNHSGFCGFTKTDLPFHGYFQTCQASQSWRCSNTIGWRMAAATRWELVFSAASATVLIFIFSWCIWRIRCCSLSWCQLEGLSKHIQT